MGNNFFVAQKSNSNPKAFWFYPRGLSNESFALLAQLELTSLDSLDTRRRMQRQINQSARGLPGFQAQNQQARNPQIAGSRLQNSRMAPNQPQWGFGGGAPGLPAPQGRAPGMSSSFAQTIGGNQASTSLDPSEFPSLSGAPQSQVQNNNQAFWSGQRQQTPVQRSQAASTGNQQGANQDHVQQNLDDAFFSSTAAGSMDDYRHRGQNGVGQLSSNQPQPGSIDDFPPLGRGGPGEIGGDRRMNMMQNAASGAFASAPGFPPGIGNARGPSEVLRSNSRPLQNGNDSSLFSSMNEPPIQRPIGSGPSQPQQGGQGAAQALSTPAENSGPTTRTAPGQMTDEQKYGLPGLLDAIRNDNNENFNLAIGHDLTSLGLDLNSSEPLHPTFGGPFASRPARPLEPDYTIPACYTVNNVPPMATKMPQFSDETLFIIFYEWTGQIEQEQAAVELTWRNWRWHKHGRFWMTKEQGFPEPVPIDATSERGHYIVFDLRSWTRKSHEMTLCYADLDDHITNAPPNSLPYP